MVEKMLVVLKFIFALLLLPLVIGTVIALQAEVGLIDPRLQQAVNFGTLAYVILKFFVYDFDAVYKFGQNIVGGCFQFLKPVMNFAPYVIPIYTIIGIVVYTILNVTGQAGGAGDMGPVFFAVIAGSFAMHIILTAQDLYAKDTIPGKPNYFFSMGLIFIVDVFFMAILLSLAGKGFSFVHFFQGLSNTSGQIYGAVFDQLFVR
jgi:hypothetical protein